MAETFLHLQDSEAHVAMVAATLLAAYIRNGEVDAGREDDYVAKSLALALKVVEGAEAAVKSDEEWVNPSGGSRPAL